MRKRRSSGSVGELGGNEPLYPESSSTVVILFRLCLLFFISGQFALAVGCLCEKEGYTFGQSNPLYNKVTVEINGKTGFYIMALIRRELL